MMRRLLVWLLVIERFVTAVGAWCMAASPPSAGLARSVRGAKRRRLAALIARTALLVLLCLGGLLSWAAAGTEASVGGSMASARPVSARGARRDELPVLSGSLVTPGSPFQGEQLRAQEVTDRSAPAAVAARAASRRRFDGLDPVRAAAVASESFPSTISEPEGLSTLAAGGQVEGYVGAHVARVALPEGEHAVIESSDPVAVESGPGKWLPVDLGLSESGGSFVVARPAVALDIPKRLGAGVGLGASGVSLAPANSAGAAVGGAEGSIQGAVVFYGGVEVGSDVDMFVKPLASGFAEDAVLRSERSPTQLSFHVGLPEGATLRQASASGVVEVVKDGQPLAAVLPPSAVDASGTTVPVSMSVTGDTLTVTVHEQAGYQFPIQVDPTVVDTSQRVGFPGGPWESSKTAETLCWNYNGGLGVAHCSLAEHQMSKRGQYVDLFYTTKGASAIYNFRADTYVGYENEPVAAKTYMTVWHSAPEAGPAQIPIGEGWHELSVASPANGNTALYEVIVSAVECSCESVESRMIHSEVAIKQESGPQASLNTANEVVNEGEAYGREWAQNALFGGRWASASSSARSKWGLVANATDPGLGVQKVTWSSPQAPNWGSTQTDGECKGVECEESWAPGRPISGTEQLPEGEDTVEAKVEDPVGLTATSGPYKVKMDDAAPYNLTLTGLPAGNEIRDGQQVTVRATATDGKKPTVSSGIASLVLEMDGQPIGSPSSGCSPGECTASGEWTFTGMPYASGKHTLTVVATDGAGNVEEAHYPVTIRHAAGVGVGPGAVNPVTGELSLSATDVSIPVPGGALVVSRSYRSRHLTQGGEGPLGPQWTLSLGGEETLAETPDGKGMVLTASDGAQTLFANAGGERFTSPAGDAGMTLTGAMKSGHFTLRENNSTIQFSAPLHGSAGVLVPSVVSGQNGTNAMTFNYEELEGTGEIEPTLALAPVPAGVSCSPELELMIKGCRALGFVYGKETKAGEAPSEWGEFKGRLKEVTYTAWEPASKEMKTKAVADYAWDKQGRLRAEWNPQTEPALKTIYGYDSENHVSAVSPPGVQPWLLHNGGIEGDPSTGRLLSVVRPPASTPEALKSEMEQSTPSNWSGPVLSSKHVALGTAVSVSSNGEWYGSPLSYAYQWERCNGTGGECVPIAGAVNEHYTPILADSGHTLRVQVSALNAAGTAQAKSAASFAVPSAPLGSPFSFGSGGSESGQFKDPGGVAVAPGGADVWATDAVNNRVEEWTSSGSFVLAAGWGVANGKSEFETCKTGCKAGLSGTGAGEFENPEGIAINQSTGTIYIASTGSSDTIQELSSSGVPAGKFGGAGSGTGQLKSPHQIAIEEGTGSVYVADTGNSRIEKFSSSGGYEATIGKPGTGNGEFSGPTGVAVAGGYLYVADTENNRVEWLTTGGSYLSSWGSKGTGQGQFSKPWAIAVDPVGGGLYVADYGNNRIEAFSTEGAFVEEFGKKGSGSKEFKSPSGIAMSSAGAAFISDEYNNRIDVWSPIGSNEEPVQPAPNPGTNAVTTIEYNVPLSGSGLPTMTTSEVAKWGQSDVPTEAAAVFPPDSPQGWPAKEYTRASLSYLDHQDRAVNQAGPTGGISTAEYNTYNDITRTLTPDNRATALAAGSKSAEVSKELDTESTYNESGEEPGTELLSTLGPKHAVQLSSGSQVEARTHTIYHYNEGAPAEGGPYHLVTKMTEGAQIPGKEEADVRTTAYSYSAQNNLGWKLHKPTATTIDPTGLKLTHSTFFEPKTGNVTETRMPAAGAPGEEQGYVFSWQFGEAGTKTGQFKEPQDVAVTATGYSYVLDSGNNRIEELSPSHALVRTFGEEWLKEPRGLALDRNGNVWTAEPHTGYLVEFGSEGYHQVSLSLHSFGQPYAEPVALTFDGSNDLYVLSTGEHAKVLKYEYRSLGHELWEVASPFGSYGSGETQFSEPSGIALGSESSIYVSDTGNNRISQWKMNGKVAEHIRNFGKAGSGNGELKSPHGLATDSSGDVWVADTANNRVQEFTPTGSFLGTIGQAGTGEGKLKEPQGVAVDGEANAVIADTQNNNVQQWTPHGTGYGNANPSPHDTQTIYYTAGANPQVAACGEHPEWANLPCQIQPAAQPEGALPKLEVTSFTYNYWLETETTTNTSGTTTRTTTQAHDAAGRPTSTQVTSTVGTALPTTTIEYNTERGTVEKQRNSEGKTITSVENTLGEPSSYTDADGATTTYEHNLDGQLTKTNTGKGTETLNYSTTTGLPSELVNEYGTSKLVFTATEDVEGNLISEGLPNGMTATTTLNATGKPVSLEYKKITHCTEKCVWFSDAVVPSIHGQWLSQTSTLSKQAYSYDTAGRLSIVQNTPAGKGCTTRLYAWDADTNRTSLTTREPNAKGECASEGGSEEKHSYDSADRLTDAGVTYNTFGNITTLPAVDAGGKEPGENLTSSFYVDNQLQSETQNGQTVGFGLDPAGRTRETVSTGIKVGNVISHYSGPGSAPSWTINTSGETSRNITGISGQLAAIQYGTEAPVLQLANLHGDLIATASVSETATELTSKADTSEFGVPAVTAPAKYAWLGAIELPTELPSGVVSMGARSYVPQLGRFLQDDPIPGGSANPYTYTFGDPVNTSDPTGAATIYEWMADHAAQVGAEALEAEIAARRAAEEAAARALAEEQARLASWGAEWAAGPQYDGGEEEWEEWEEEEGEYEYVSNNQHEGSGKEEIHIDPAVLYQPLAKETLASKSAPHQSEARVSRSQRNLAEQSTINAGPRRIPASSGCPGACSAHYHGRAVRWPPHFAHVGWGALGTAYHTVVGALEYMVKGAQMVNEAKHGNPYCMVAKHDGNGDC